MFHLILTRRIAIIVVFAHIFLCEWPQILWSQEMKKSSKALEEGKILSPNSDRKLANSISEEKKMVIIGASYVKGWPIRDIGAFKVINKGVNGNQSFEMLARFREDVIANKPQMVVIWGFINDIFGSKRENIQTTLEKIKENYQQMVKISNDHGVKAIITTEITVRPPESWKESMAGFVGKILGKESYQTYVNKHVVAMNDWIKEFAKENKLLLLDFQTVLSDTKGIRKKEFAAKDGSHISPEGYEALTLYTKNHLGRALQ